MQKFKELLLKVRGQIAAAKSATAVNNAFELLTAVFSEVT